MTLDEVDRHVREADTSVVKLDTVPTVYLDEDGVTFEPVGPIIPEADDDTLFFLVGLRHPGVAFDLPAWVFRLRPEGGDARHKLSRLVHLDAVPNVYLTDPLTVQAG